MICRFAVQMYFSLYKKPGSESGSEITVKARSDPDPNSDPEKNYFGPTTLVTGITYLSSDCVNQWEKYDQLGHIQGKAILFE